LVPVQRLQVHGVGGLAGGQLYAALLRQF
jgi:hypothetical protein